MLDILINEKIIVALNKINHTIAINSTGNDEVNIAIFSLAISIISIIVACFTDYTDRHNSSHWNEKLYRHDLKKVSVSSVRIFGKYIWKPLLNSNLISKFRKGTLSNRSKSKLAHILGNYRHWRIYLHNDVSDVKLTKKYLKYELRIINKINDTIKMLKKGDNHRE